MPNSVHAKSIDFREWFPARYLSDFYHHKRKLNSFFYTILTDKQQQHNKNIKYFIACLLLLYPDFGKEKIKIAPQTTGIKWFAAFQFNPKVVYRTDYFLIFASIFLFCPKFGTSTRNQYYRLVRQHQEPHHGSQKQKGFPPVCCPSRSLGCQPIVRRKSGILFSVAGDVEAGTKQSKSGKGLLYALT